MKNLYLLTTLFVALLLVGLPQTVHAELMTADNPVLVQPTKKANKTSKSSKFKKLKEKVSKKLFKKQASSNKWKPAVLFWIIAVVLSIVAAILSIGIAPVLALILYILASIASLAGSVFFILFLIEAFA